MTEREQKHEKLAHTKVEKKRKRSEGNFFINLKTLKKKKVTLTSQLLPEQIGEKTTAKLSFCATKPH